MTEQQFNDELWPIVVEKEGEEVTDDPNDRGGYSVAGIAGAMHPNEQAILDAKRLGLKDGDKIPAELIPVCQDYYKRKWVDALRLGEINDADYRKSIFSRAINFGASVAIKFAQEAAGVPLTGEIDDATVNALNSAA